MKTGLQIFIAFVLFLLLDFAAGYIVYTKAWIKLDGINAPITTNNQSVQGKFFIKRYSDPQMHLTFNYPTNLQITQVRPHLISLQSPSSTSADSSLFIFETTASSDAKTIDIPFVINAKLLKQTKFLLHDFSAKQFTYSDGIDYLTLQKDQEFIMLRIPKDSSNLDAAINDIVDSIKTFH